MITLLKWLIILLFSLLLIALAVVNRHAMSISLYPLPYEIGLPTYGFAALFFLCGFVMAALAGGLRRSGQSLKLHSSRKRVEALENEIAGLRQSVGKPLPKA